MNDHSQEIIYFLIASALLLIPVGVFYLNRWWTERDCFWIGFVNEVVFEVGEVIITASKIEMLVVRKNKNNYLVRLIKPKV